MHHGMNGRPLGADGSTEKAPVPGFARLFEGLTPGDWSDADLDVLAARMEETVDHPSQDNGPVGTYPGMPSGFAFLGQFVDHDVTFDPVSRLGHGPASTKNFRTPLLDLDSVYGAGPDASRHLYDVCEPESSGGRLPIRLLVDGHDVPRNQQAQALIGDPRNDENHFISQLHHRFLEFHNRAVGTLPPGDPRERFEAARTLVIQHYHHVLLTDFLPRLVRADVLQEVIRQRKPRIFDWRENFAKPFIPIEFSVAAYRMGHTLIRSKYRLNQAEAVTLFGAKAFDRRDASYAIDFRYFVGSNPEVQYARRVDELVTTELFRLPFIDATHDAPISLPARNLRRGVQTRLPAGQAVARELIARVPRALAPVVLTDAELRTADLPVFKDQAPLWYYILRESNHREEGHTLGHVGSWIVAEVLVELMRAVSASPLNIPGWAPTLGDGGEFTLADLVGIA